MASLFITYVALIYICCFFCSPVIASSCSTVSPIWLPLQNITIPLLNNLPDVVSWGALIKVENSSQVVTVPSTVVNGTWLMSSEVCDTLNLNNETAAQCRSRRGNFVTRSDLTPTSTSSLPSDPGWAAIMSPSPAAQYAVNAVLQLRSDASVQMLEGLITQGQNHTASHLGLGIESELLNQLVDAGMIPGRSWGLNSGSQSVIYPRDGSIVLGGYDDNSVKGSFVDYSINYPVAEGPGGRDCPLQVTVQSMILRPAGGSDISLSDISSPFVSCIEPYDNLFRLPTNVHQLFLSNTGLSSEVQTDPSILVLEPGITYQNTPNSTFGFNASLIITLNNGFQVEIPNYELVHPLRGLAPNGSRVLNTSIMEVQVYSDPVPLGASVLGKAFLSQVYLGVDYDQKIFKTAQINTNAVIPAPVPFQQCPSKLSATSIGLIVVGITLALVLLAILFFAIKKAPRFRDPETRNNEEDPSKPSTEHNPEPTTQVPPEPVSQDPILDAIPVTIPNGNPPPSPTSQPVEVSAERKMSEMESISPTTTDQNQRLVGHGAQVNSAGTEEAEHERHSKTALPRYALK